MKEIEDYKYELQELKRFIYLHILAFPEPEWRGDEKYEREKLYYRANEVDDWVKKLIDISGLDQQERRNLEEYCRIKKGSENKKMINKYKKILKKIFI